MTTKILDRTELFAAVEKEDFGLVTQLITQGVDLNASSENGWTPLMLAILRDSIVMVRLLLGNGADPNLTTQSEENPCRSPLMVAVSNGRLEAVRLLLSYNANINLLDTQRQTALDLAQKLSLRPLHRDKMLIILSLLKERQNHLLLR
jgi:ankyrin repeat protein